MPRGWTRTRVDKEGNAIFGSTVSTAPWMPDLTDVANCRRAAAVLRDVHRQLVETNPQLVDPIELVWDIGHGRTDRSADCALAALRDHQTHHHPGWTSWPARMPAGDLARIVTATAAELDAAVRDTPFTTDERTRR